MGVILVHLTEQKLTEALLKYDSGDVNVPSLIKRDANIEDIREAIMYYDSVKETGKYENEILYAVVLKESNTIIGVITVSDSEILYELQVGWMIRGEYSRRGYASEAAKAVTDYLFTTYHYEYIIVVMDIDNPASYQTALKSESIINVIYTAVITQL